MDKVVEITALKDFRAHAKRAEKGTTVAVTEKDAKYLIARGLAAPADAVPQTDTDTDAEAGADVTAEAGGVKATTKAAAKKAK